MPADLFQRPATHAPVTIAPGTDALAALARAFGFDHALSFPHRPQAVSEGWLARYAETHGLHQPRQFHAALHRLPHDQRAAIAADLTREDRHG